MRIKRLYGSSQDAVIPRQEFPRLLPRGWRWGVTDADLRHPDRRLVQIGGSAEDPVTDLIVPLTAP